jgi:periplasmic protein TonB
MTEAVRPADRPAMLIHENKKPPPFGSQTHTRWRFVMFKLLKVALPLTLVLAVPTTTAAASNEIVVTGAKDAELKRWTSRVEQGISRQMRFPRSVGQAPVDSGLVDVTFKCSQDGSPSEVTIAQTSGSRQIDRAGVRAIERLKTLHPLPDGITHGQVYRARLLFASDKGMAKQIIALREEARAGNSRLVQRMGERTTAGLTLLPPDAF